MSHHNDGHGAKVVRNACDACHTRKIRCETPQGGGPCLNCQSKDLSCYFLPRYKSGRPRVNAALPDEASGGRTRAAERAASSRGSRQSNASLEWSPGIGLPGDPELASPPAVQATTPQHHLQWHARRTAHDPSHLALDYGFWDTSQPGGLPGLSAECLLDGDLMLPALPRTAFGPLSPSISPQKPPDDHPALPAAGPRRPGHETDGDTGFLALLQHCGQLQRLILAPDGPTPEDDPHHTPEQDDALGHLGDMLECVDASCNLMLRMCDGSGPARSGSGAPQPLDLASLSLVMAVVCKVLQACGICMRHPGMRASSIKGMLLQKKLDLNITQVRVVVAHVEQAGQGGPTSFKELSERCGNLSQRLAGLHQRAYSFSDMTVDLISMPDP